MRWRPGVRCAPHDHGDSCGTIHLIEGSFIERRFRFLAGALECVAIESYDAPAVLHIEADVIHDMVAPDGGLSIHRYASVIRGMRVWDVDARRTLVVDDECGAWVPSNDELIVESKRWNEVS